MISSEDKEEREFAVKTILKLRGRKKEGDLSPRARKHPELNLEATNLQELISWKGAKEPVLTCKLSREELLQFREVKMEVPYYPVHTQAIERAVK